MGELFSNPKTKWLLLAAAGAVIVLYFVLFPGESINLSIEDESLVFSYKDQTPTRIAFEDILSVEMTAGLGTGTLVEGAKTEQCQAGLWQNEEYGQYHLYTYTSVPQVIMLKTTSGICVFNMGSSQETRSFYDAFLELLAQPVAAQGS